MNSATASSTGLLQQRPFVLFWLARLASTMGYQMLTLTIGWQIYEITNSAFDLGLVGLIQFVPAVVFTLLIGHAADRYDRRLIVRAAHCIYALAASMIMIALLTKTLGRDLLFAAVFIIGCARALEMPTAHALAPIGSIASDLACGRRLDIGQPDGRDLRTRARRLNLCDKPCPDRRHLSLFLYLLDHADHIGQDTRTGAFS
jgi:Transmembrane secretion effector